MFGADCQKAPRRLRQPKKELRLKARADSPSEEKSLSQHIKHLIRRRDEKIARRKIDGGRVCVISSTWLWGGGHLKFEAPR